MTKARDLMSRPVISVGPDDTVREAVTRLTGKGFAALPVVDEGGRVVGIFSESDAVRATLRAGDGGDHRDDPVSTAMTSPVEVVSPGTDMVTVAERMLAGRLRCLPVVEEGLLVGVVARRDLLRTLLRDDDVVAADVRALLDDYAGSRRRWRVEVTGGAVVIGGEFADRAERAVVTALAHTAAGVNAVELRPVTGLALRWDD
ncbi:MAG TPA: CBS domain-containing protein [Actinophytocola sp.]|uniref:CBS domain-containing protein n=1 Tax=Actinophytocola sp. TaxID=1872138 RepID=UPI002DB6FAE9|nr:CBS domain-containing protein [Actinophytocola sp.]HEU5471232.1 CBS domain-containing protein [Actinophytocola sp.]